jgi:hypothetical protein
MRYILALVVLLAGAASAHAEPPAADFQLYAEGKYDEAIRAGLARNNAAGLRDAARAELAEEASRDKPCLECLERAEGFARRAVAADPKLSDAQVYLAFSLGLKAHVEGPLVARLKGYPGEAKRALDAALAADPKNAWALAARGGWNIAIVRGGGKALARLFYGATLKKGLDDFAAAFAAAPDNIVVLYQYALTLSEYDTVHYHDYIAAALTHVVSSTTETVYERLIQKRAGELLELLKRGDRDAFAARVRKFEGYP